MNTVFVTIRPGSARAPEYEMSRLSTTFPRVARARLLAMTGVDLDDWAAALRPHRVSLDIDAEDCLAAPWRASSRYIRQLRLRVTYRDAERIGSLLDAARPQGSSRPVVFLLPASALLDDPRPWAEALAPYDNTFVNPLRSLGHEAWLLAGSSERSQHLVGWRRSLGPRWFVSLPTEVAAAGLDAAPCPAALGMHAFIDLVRRRVSLCDCSERFEVPWDGDARLVAEEFEALKTQWHDESESACRGCHLWNACRGGCLGPSRRSVGRDIACHWLDHPVCSA